jgi:hypothetical protein
MIEMQHRLHQRCYLIKVLLLFGQRRLQLLLQAANDSLHAHTKTPGYQVTGLQLSITAATPTPSHHLQPLQLRRHITRQQPFHMNYGDRHLT